MRWRRKEKDDAMNWFRKLLFVMPRPSIGWLSFRDVYEIYDRLRFLYYQESRLICAPGILWGTFPIQLRTNPAAGPLFEFSYDESHYRFFLECHPKRRCPRVHFQRDDEEIEIIELNDVRCGVLRGILRGLHYYFPLYPSEDNVVYLDRMGEFG